MIQPTLKRLIFTLLALTSAVQAQDESWRVLPTGAGGWATGMSIHPSGNPVFTRVDVGSAYRLDRTTMNWVNVVGANNIPESDVYWNQYDGVLSIVSAPSDANRAYLAYNDGIYRSDNQGDDWTKTSFPSTPMPANKDDSKTSGERLSVDPVNKDVVYMATIEDGLWKSDNAGITWGQVANIPNGIVGRGVRQVLFDPSSIVIAGKTSRVLVTVDGEGMFESTDAGNTWQLTDLGFSGPVFLDAEINATGQVYTVGYDFLNQTLGIMVFRDNTWQSLQNNGTTYFNVAVDPQNTERVMTLSFGFTETALTTNASNASPTWFYPTRTRIANNIPWLEWSQGEWFVIGEAEFDPINPDQLWISDGVGTWLVDGVNNQNMIWEEQSLKQEHLVSNDLVVNGQGQQVTMHWDRPVFLHQDEENYPLIHQPSERFNSAWDMDNHPNNLDFIVGIIEDHRECCLDNQTRYSGYSSDGGATWTPFPTNPVNDQDYGVFGNIALAANDNNNVVWLPSGNRTVYFSRDLGNTWTAATLPNFGDDCCHKFNFSYKKALTADRVLPNTFYIYNWQNGSIYVSENGGETWSERTALQDFYGFHAKLVSTPGQAGHLWYAHNAESDINVMQPLKRSTDAGLSWTTLTNTSEILNAAVGPPLTLGGYPAVYIQGRVDGEFGYWLSADEGVTWQKIGQHPEQVYDVARVMEADPVIPGKLYVGFPGNGFVIWENDLIFQNGFELD